MCARKSKIEEIQEYISNLFVKKESALYIMD